jgi:2-haloacid dehalogenase
MAHLTGRIALRRQTNRFQNAAAPSVNLPMCLAETVERKCILLVPMNQVNVHAIVFDLGGVLMDWNPRYLYRKLLNNDVEAVDRFLTRIGFTEWNEEQDRGRPFVEAVAELCGKFPDDADLIRAYDQRYEESLAGPIQPTVNILHTLKQAGYPLCALSNWPAEKFDLVRPKYEFLGWFDEIVVSGAVKLLKPDPRIFAVLLDRIGRRAEECVFIDDSPANIVTANQLGFKTIQYESPEQLEAGLHQLGLL